MVACPGDRALFSFVLWWRKKSRTKANKKFFRDDYGASLIRCFGPMRCIRLKERSKLRDSFLRIAHEV